MKKILIFFGIVVLSVSVISGATLPGLFTVSLPNDAILLAMNGSGRSSVSGLSAMNLNPAQLTTIRNKEIGVSYTKYFADYNLFSLGFGYNMAKIGVLAVSFSYFTASDLALNDSSGVQYDTAKFNDMVGKLSYSRTLIRNYLNFGITGKFLKKTMYQYSGIAYAGDIGLSSKLIIFPIALTLENLGTGKLDGTTIALPQTTSLALSYIADFQGNTIAVNFDTKTYIDFKVLPDSIDMQYLFSASYFYNKLLKVMGSYNLNTGEMGVGAGFYQFGFGLEVGYAVRDVAPIYSVNLKYFL